MPTTLKTAVANYLRSGNPARGTRAEYLTTLRKWKKCGYAVGWTMIRPPSSGPRTMP